MRPPHADGAMIGGLIRPLALGIVAALAAASCGGSNDAAETVPPVSDSSAATDPAATEPPATAVVVADPPATDPLATDPAATEPPATDRVPTDPPAVPAWLPIEHDGECVCADGTPVEFFERRADPTKVVFFFEGGGACFSAETCAFDGGTYTSGQSVSAASLGGSEGIFDLANPENPLGDHSFVFVPYCTGDGHLGNATTDYSDELTVRHNGYANGLIALDHLAATYPDAAQVVVAGASAGSIPTPLFAGLVADRLPAAEIVTFGDSSAAYPDVPALNATIGGLWGTTAAIPDWPVNEGITAEEWSLPGLYVQAGLHAPDITFARFDFAFDETQAFFGGLAGVPADELVTLIDQSEADIEAAGVPLATYVAPGTEHTIVGDDAFYDLEVEGVRLVDWLVALLAGDVPADVHCEVCN